MRHLSTLIALLVIVVIFALPSAFADKERLRLLNVSYDPTREFYHEYNQEFAAFWQARTGDEVVIRQSHGGSGKQARSVLMGLGADVLTLALAYDIDVLAEKTGKIPRDWQSKLPNNSSPYTSTIVFLVRKGNPKHITDWDDLVRKDVSVITPNPKTSGGARWNYLAAWVYASTAYRSNMDGAIGYMRKLFQNVPVLDAGARGATTTFAQRRIGDVLITWENEAHLAIQQLGKDRFEIIMPSISILAEPPVVVVEANARKHGTFDVATAYLTKLYEPKAQRLAMKHYYRPRDLPLLYSRRDLFPSIPLVSIDSMGGWKKVHEEHFADGGIFDQIYARE